MQTSVQGLAEFRATESTPKKTSLLNASARADTASTGSSRPEKWHSWYTAIMITVMISTTAVAITMTTITILLLVMFQLAQKVLLTKGSQECHWGTLLLYSSHIGATGGILHLETEVGVVVVVVVVVELEQE